MFILNKITKAIPTLILCFAGELALDIGSVGRNENVNDSHYHGNMINNKKKII